MKNIMRWEQANYSKAILPEYQGNPLIEALPKKASDSDVIEKFCNYPDLSSHIRTSLDYLEREEYLARIDELRQPLPQYIECFRAIERAIKSGYLAKNPLTPTTMQYLHYPVDARPNVEPATGYFVPKGKGITLIGDSGVGKTCMLEQVLSYFPHVIEHGNYNGKPLDFKYQVVWVKVDCPRNSSVRELCEEILFSLDSAMRNERTTPGSTIPKLLTQIEQKIKSSHLGILVIDEMQNLQFKRTGGENNLLKFLHHIVNKLGVPLFFCANPPFDDSLALTLKNARRAESGRTIFMKPLQRHDIGWESFIAELWDLQWTNVETRLSEELNDKMYELSLGNIDMACRIYCEAQRLVIGTGDENITSAVLEYAYPVACSLSSRTNEVIEARQNLILPRRTAKQNTVTKILKTKLGKPRIIGDYNRPHHPEFEVRLRELHLTDKLLHMIGDPDLIQRGVATGNVPNYMRDVGMLCDEHFIFSEFGEL
ncbi:ATP-binding protein [Vibrio cholerae]|uniref:ATP-binding protein n=1 Tax=Vibrio cholerae TaxID=666 RepID=UPI001F07509E|nr:ATP-binding protein [Vibrio cholerae]